MNLWKGSDLAIEAELGDWHTDHPDKLIAAVLSLFDGTSDLFFRIDETVVTDIHRGSTTNARPYSIGDYPFYRCDRVNESAGSEIFHRDLFFKISNRLTQGKYIVEEFSPIDIIAAKDEPQILSPIRYYPIWVSSRNRYLPHLSVDRL